MEQVKSLCVSWQRYGVPCSPSLKYKGQSFELINLHLADLQSFAGYLRLTLVFMWNSKMQESFNFYFSAVFC